MSLAQVGDRKDIWPQNLCIECTLPPFFTTDLRSEKVMVCVGGMLLKSICGEGASMENHLTQVCLEAWLSVCVCVFMHCQFGKIR